MANTIAELLQKVTDKILVGGRRTTATNSKDVYNSIIESNLNIKDGGFVVESETGYTTEITPTDPKSFATKKYVDENGGGGGGNQNLQSVTDFGNTTTDTIETTGFVKTGGTSSQFLKADGSIDSSNYLEENTSITGATKTKITYDSKGLVTSGTDATTFDINDSANRRYVTDANLTTIGNQSGTNTGDETKTTIETKLGFASVTALTPAFFNATKNLVSLTAITFATWLSAFAPKPTPADTDTITINDGTAKLTTWLEFKTTLKTYFDSLYAQLTANNTFTGVNMFNATSNNALTDGRFITNGGNNNIVYNTFNKTPYQVTGSLQFDDAIGHLGGAYSVSASSGALKNRDTFSRRYSATGVEFGARNDGAGTNTLGKPNIVVSYGFYDEVNDNIVATATPKFRVFKTASTPGALPNSVEWIFDKNPLVGVAKGIACTFSDAIRIVNSNFTGNSTGQAIDILNGVLTRTSGLNGTQLQMCDGINWRGLIHLKGLTSPTLSTIASTQNAIPKFQNATDLEVTASNLIDDGTTLKYGLNRIELEQNIISQNGNYTITSNNYIILCTNTSNFTLPSTAGLVGKVFIIYSNNFHLVINRAGSDLVNGSVSVSYTGYTKVEVRCLANNVWLTN